MTDATDESTPPPSRAKPLRLGRCDNLKGARRAIWRVTNAILAGTLPPSQANSALYGLATLSRVLEVEILERRVDALEAALGQGRVIDADRNDVPRLSHTLDA